MKKIVQIGVANAEDHVSEFVKKNYENYFVYLIEPNLNSISLIKNVYSFTKLKQIFNFAISTYDGTVDIYFPTENYYKFGNSQIASVNKHHLEVHMNTENDDHSSIVSKSVKCFKLNTFFENIISLQDEYIEILFIDTEGHDCDILMTTDFKKFNVKKIVFEYAHSEGPQVCCGEKLNNTIEYLKTFGYEEIEEDWGIGNKCFIRRI